MKRILQNGQLFQSRLGGLITLLLILFLLPTAAIAVTQSTVESRLAELRTLAGKYFTTTGEPCTSSYQSGHGCKLCSVVNVIASGSTFRTESGLNKWPSSFSMTHGRYNNAFTRVSNGQSCVGFANFAGWYLFADSSSSKVNYSRLIDCRYNEVYKYAKPGDIIASKGHSMVYISGTASKIRVLDCNYSNNVPQCKIQEREFSTSNTMVTISRSDTYELSDSDRFKQLGDPVEGANGHLYYLFSGRCSWEEAKSFIENNYSDCCHLVTINSAEEQSLVANLVQKWNDRGHGGLAWTGAHYVNGEWEWVNGESFGDYSNWATSGSSSSPYSTIMGQSGSNGSITYSASKWYAQKSIDRWAMPGFVMEYTPYASEMTYFNYFNELLPQYIKLGTSFTYYGWCETNVPIGQVDVSLTKDDSQIGAVCWYPTFSASKTKIYFSDIVQDITFMDTANWTKGTYYYSFTYYDETGNYLNSYNSSALVTSSACSHNQTFSNTIIEPTCSHVGEEWECCSQCRIPLEKISDIPALDHTPGEWQTVLEATPTTTGLRELYCIVCNECINSIVIPKLDTLALLEYKVVYKNGINVRRTPGKSNNIIGSMSNGTHFFVYDGTQVEADGYTWAYSYVNDNLMGYVGIGDTSLVQPVSSASSNVSLYSHETDENSGHIYRLYQGAVTWDYARMYANSLGEGWQLACMDGDSEYEQSIIEELVVSFNKACWLGGNNLSGRWMWLSGIPIDVNDSRWDENEPSGNYKSSTENYLGIYANNTQTSYSTARKWNDFQLTSTTPKGFVVEYTPVDKPYNSQNVLTLPSSLTTIESEAFKDLPNVDAIRIPASVTGIAADAFDSSVILLDSSGNPIEDSIYESYEPGHIMGFDNEYCPDHPTAIIYSTRYSYYNELNNTNQHLLVNADRFFCSICGKDLYFSPYTDTTYVEDHAYNSDGICTKCGHKRTGNEADFQ